MRRIATLGLALALALLGWAGTAMAQADPDCAAKLRVVDTAQEQLNDALAAAEKRAKELGLSAGLVASVKADVEGGLSTAEKTGILANLPIIVAAGGGGQADLDLALRVEAKANALAEAQDAAEGCEVRKDLDCVDFPLPDGKTAQDVYNEDKSDPNNLDANNNGKPCEGGSTDFIEDVDLYRPDTSGGIATGGA